MTFDTYNGTCISAADTDDGGDDVGGSEPSSGGSLSKGAKAGASRHHLQRLQLTTSDVILPVVYLVLHVSHWSLPCAAVRGPALFCSATT